MESELKIVSVNLGKRKTIQIGNQTKETGIFKQPQGKVMITKMGVVDDAVIDTAHHGGADQAVYLYTQTDYDWWATTLQRELSAGMFGENLTISSFGPHTLKIGDRLQINDVLLEITAPRIPCSTLAARMGDPGFVKEFVAAKRPGVYLRVLQPGEVQAGDPIEFISAPQDYLTVLELYDLWYVKDRDPALLRKGLAAPVGERAAQALQYWLNETPAT